MTTRQTFTASDGLKIAYYIDDFTDPWTQPPVLVLLHSAMGNSQRFYSWVPALARHFRVVRMDLRGHGGSDIPPADMPLSMDRFVRDVEELMDTVGAKQAHIVANSAGGYLAQKLAITAPERVLGLAVVGSTPGLSPSALDWLPLIEKEGLTPFLTRTIHMRFDLASTDPGMIRWFLEQTAENDPAYVVRFIGYMATQEWSAELPRIKAPTLVIYPGGETVGSANSYDSMRERIPDVTMIEYEHMPHNIADMMPDRCTADILAFLSTKFGTAKV
ncbi:alpha/beta fold hydrolase [Falsiroseomonas sp.]|uniref:alpha/beta fold hydrolase n=1 Tax=Falsiroseomonas sp. TaxID=2870721 RepID=UPI00272835CA|nr:alpha/beta hydrolase [Falsiroseomonas sp.]MDO9498690.1 alpha/beta hydrolase [Falsiroseomonas sp.]